MVKRLFITFGLLIFATLLSATEKLYIGLDADLSSVAKQGGLAIQRGAQLAIDEINASGGLLGKQLELIPKDHKGNPARGISNLKKLSAQDNLIAVLGGVHTPVVLQELQTIHDNELLFLVPWAAGTPITTNEYSPNYVFRVSIRDKEAGPVLVKYAASKGAKSIALMLERTGWGRSNQASMTEAASELGITVTGTHWINWGEKTVETQISAIEKESPDAVMLVANAPEGIVFSEGLLANTNLQKTPVIAHWGIAGGAFVKGLGLDKVMLMDISTIQTFNFLNAYDQKKADAVLQSYKAKYDADADKKNVPGVVGLAQAYDLVHMLAIAVAEANSASRPAIRNAFESLGKYKGLIQEYDSPFNETQHDALLGDDYFIARFDSHGNLVPR